MSATYTVAAPKARDARDRLVHLHNLKTGDDIEVALKGKQPFTPETMADIRAGFGRHKRVARLLRRIEESTNVSES